MLPQEKTQREHGNAKEKAVSGNGYVSSRSGRKTSQSKKDRKQAECSAVQRSVIYRLIAEEADVKVHNKITETHADVRYQSCPFRGSRCITSQFMISSGSGK